MDHPSQTRNACLYEPSAYYFHGCFDEISLKLLRPELKNILAQALNLCGVTPHLQRIQGAVEMILFELKDEMYIVKQLASNKQRLLDETCEQIVYNAVDNWKLADTENPGPTSV